MDLTIRNVWFVSVGLACLASLGILSIQPWIAGIEFAPDEGFNWYFWKRPDADIWSRATAWVFYLSHQMFIWGVIFWATRHRDQLRDRNKLHPINYIALGGTAFFVVLHYVQTAIWYDGLSQDLPVITSQMSVIILLVIVLLMEAPRRGLFFGAGKGWFAGTRAVLIRYHGYYFAWAITFTYWYHPMETSAGHVTGFLYTFLLFLQAAFIFTRVHSNRIWTLILEVSVLVHGVVVAVVAGQEFWPMFAFGFLFMFVVTQMHGVGLSKLARWAIAIIAIAAMLYVYSGRGWGNMNEVIRIPVIDYVMVAILGGLILLGKWVAGRFGPRRA